MSFLIISLACFGFLVVLALATAFWLAASSAAENSAPRDVFGFASLPARAADVDIPPLKRYTTRDGEELAYRIYDSSSERVLIFVHGSSYHGAGYHALASSISISSAAKVVLPNLRGHFQSGRRRGDVDYIGQLEDDLMDLIAFLRREGVQGPIILGGHSSGGGLSIRFAGGAYAPVVSNFLLLSPVIPTSSAMRTYTDGGWANVNLRRLYGLLILNAFGIHAFDVLPIIEFNKPVKFWDGTETLSYSYRLNAAYHPRYRYARDLRALDDKTFVLVGADDEAIDPDALRALLNTAAPRARIEILPHTNHFGIFSDTKALQTMTSWLCGLPIR